MANHPALNPQRDVHAVKDGSNDKGYFIITPRIVWAMCRNPFDFVLWCVVKDIAGERRECYVGARNLGKLAMMSPGQVRASRTYLLKVGLLQGEKLPTESTGLEVWHLSVPDLWPQNMRWCEEYSSIESRIAFKARLKSDLEIEKIQPKLIETPLPFMDEEGYPSSTVCYPVAQYATEGHTMLLEGHTMPSSSIPCPQVAQGDLKEEQEEQSEQEERGTPVEKDKNNDAIWELALGEMKLQLASVTFDTWLGRTNLVQCDAERRSFIVGVHNSAAQDMLKNRLATMVKRTLAGIVGHDVEVAFIVNGNHRNCMPTRARR